MAIAKELRRSFLTRSRGLEASLRRLVFEIMDELPEEGRDRIRYVNSKVDVLFGGVEELIYLDSSGPGAEQDRKIAEARKEFDEITALQARIDRKRRDIRRQREDLTIEEKRTFAAQLERELGAESDGGEGD